MATVESADLMAIEQVAQQLMPRATQVSMARLLMGFHVVSNQNSTEEKTRLRDNLRSITKLLDEYRSVHKKWAAKQQFLADDFNVLEVLGIDYKELFHSRLLAWLLDCRIERGTHAQGNLGFRLFLDEFRHDLDPTGSLSIENYACENYRVRREVSASESRVDIEILAVGKFIIHIENKILSEEGEAQTEREWNDLNRRAEPKRHALFLTLDGRPADEVNFCAIGWSRIARILERFAEQASPPVVKLFARHYADALRKLVASHTTEELFRAETDLQ